jgi:hypothetical protein
MIVEGEGKRVNWACGAWHAKFELDLSKKWRWRVMVTIDVFTRVP